MPNRALTHPRGHTLIELILVMVLIGLTSLIGLRQVHLYLDRIATRDAVRAARNVVARARDEAVALHTPVSVRIDTTSATLELLNRNGAFGRAALGELHGVALSTTRDSITFDVRGLGYGAANLTLVARRGRASDTLVVSRLGRVRD
jgi:prepilin-type N-terminal cleavage/methylation domain-containing protein